MDAPEPLSVATTPAAGTPAGTLVLLHGLTDNGASWADAVRRWSAAGWDVVAVDARGHGASPRWRTAELAGPGDVMARDVVDVLGGLDGPAVLVGHSMGAAVAVAAAALSPGRVAAVVAEDPPWSLPPRRPDAVRALGWVREHAADLRTPRQVRIDRQHAQAPSWPVAELGPWADAVEQTDPALLETGDIVPHTPWPALVTALHGAGVPLLLVTGDRDVLVDEATEQEARARGAEVVRLPRAGHCVRRDAGEAYHDVVDRFLDRLTATGTGA